MSSTYTSNIRLTKQGSGENNNSWGTIFNQVLDLVDGAIGAYTTITVSSADVTLTSNNGTADQARSPFIELAGAVTGSLNVVIPAVSKGYVVRNTATVSAGTSITVKTAAGTGINIPAGSIQMIVCDGVSVVGLNAVGLGLGTASTRNVGTSATDLIDVSIADARYTPPTVSLTDGTSIAVDFALGRHFKVTLAGNRTLAAPTNPVVGQVGHIYIIQDATGSRTLSFDTDWKFPSGTAPTLSTSIGAVDMLVWSYRATSVCDAILVKDFKR